MEAEDLNECDPNFSEAATRFALIDPVLVARGWRYLIEPELLIVSPIDDSRTRADYALYLDDNTDEPFIVAFLEAKRSGLTPEHGLEQCKIYAELQRSDIRFVFSTNGCEFVQLDRLTGTVSSPK